MKRISTIIAVAVLLVGCGGDDQRYLSMYGISNLELSEFETKPMQVRYLDNDGYPIQGGAVRLTIQGDSGGAVLETIVARTDAQGLATTNLRAARAANFTIVVSADYAAPTQVPVNVARTNGGMLEVQVYSRAAATATQAQVTIVNNYPCSSFDPRMPPAASSDVAQAAKNVSVSANGAPVQFAGLKAGKTYTVVAIATSGASTVARGCQDNITITQEEIDRRLARTSSVYLEDFTTDISGNGLLLQTTFTYPLNLLRVANLFRDMSDSPGDPIDFIIDRALSNGGMALAIFAGVVKDQLKNYIVQNNQSSMQARQKLSQVATVLSQIRNVNLFTTMHIKDEVEDANGNNKGQLTATHRFRYFTATVGGQTQQYYLKPGVSIAGGDGAMTLETDAVLKLTEANRLEIEPHTLSLPVADAIIGTLLIDTFAEYDLKSVFSSMVDCSGIASLAGDFARNNLYESSIVSSLASSAMNSACKNVIGNMLSDLYSDINQDIKDAGLGEEVTFEGRADVSMRADGKTIGNLTNGKWIGVGTFTAERF